MTPAWHDKAALLHEITDQQVIASFESGAISASEFHHADHVRLAFAYLQEHPVLSALERFSAALKKFAANNGKAQLYHETITCAYIFLIAERIARSDAEKLDWNRFAEKNSDLLVWKCGILSRYYQDATLKSDLARRTFVFPDKCA